MLKLKTLDAFYKIQSFALYDALKPSTQLEKVENVEQLDVKSLPSL